MDSKGFIADAVGAAIDANGDYQSGAWDPPHWITKLAGRPDSVMFQFPGYCKANPTFCTDGKETDGRGVKGGWSGHTV